MSSTVNKNFTLIRQAPIDPKTNLPREVDFAEKVIGKREFPVVKPFKVRKPLSKSQVRQCVGTFGTEPARAGRVDVPPPAKEVHINRKSYRDRIEEERYSLDKCGTLDPYAPWSRVRNDEGKLRVRYEDGNEEKYQPFVEEVEHLDANRFDLKYSRERIECEKVYSPSRLREFHEKISSPKYEPNRYASPRSKGLVSPTSPSSSYSVSPHHRQQYGENREEGKSNRFTFEDVDISGAHAASSPFYQQSAPHRNDGAPQSPPPPPGITKAEMKFLRELSALRKQHKKSLREVEELYYSSSAHAHERPVVSAVEEKHRHASDLLSPDGKTISKPRRIPVRDMNGDIGVVEYPVVDHEERLLNPGESVTNKGWYSDSDHSSSSEDEEEEEEEVVGARGRGRGRRKQLDIHLYPATPPPPQAAFKSPRPDIDTAKEKFIEKKMKEPKKETVEDALEFKFKANPIPSYLSKVPKRSPRPVEINTTKEVEDEHTSGSQRPSSAGEKKKKAWDASPRSASPSHNKPKPISTSSLNLTWKKKAVKRRTEKQDRPKTTVTPTKKKTSVGRTKDHSPVKARPSSASSNLKKKEKKSEKSTTGTKTAPKKNNNSSTKKGKATVNKTVKSNKKEEEGEDEEIFTISRACVKSPKQRCDSPVIDSEIESDSDFSIAHSPTTYKSNGHILPRHHSFSALVAEYNNEGEEGEDSDFEISNSFIRPRHNFSKSKSRRDVLEEEEESEDDGFTIATTPRGRKRPSDRAVEEESDDENEFTVHTEHHLPQSESESDNESLPPDFDGVSYASSLSLSKGDGKYGKEKRYSHSHSEEDEEDEDEQEVEELVHLFGRHSDGSFSSSSLEVGNSHHHRQSKESNRSESRGNRYEARDDDEEDSESERVNNNGELDNRSEGGMSRRSTGSNPDEVVSRLFQPTVRQSSLRRMRKREEEEKREKERKRAQLKAKDVPDYQKLQEEFSRRLSLKKEKAKEQQKATVVEEFQFADRKPRRRTTLTAEEQFELEKKQREAEKKKREKTKKKKMKEANKKSPSIPSHGTTRTAELLRKKNAEQIKAREKKEKEREAEKVKPSRSTTKRVRNKLRQQDSEHRAKVKEQDKAKREEIEKNEKAYRKEVREISRRFDRRPSLLSDEAKRKERVEARRKALLKVKASLDKAGVTDYSSFFDPEELDDLDLHF